jgi:deazaflavin-dependent oxidoreductase (nitroreductase family)
MATATSRQTAAPDRQRKHNPFITSATGGRLLSALQLPFFMIRPPSGYGILVTTGRKSGKTRRRCVRATRRHGQVVIVAIKGPRTGWLKNFECQPEVRVRIRGGTFAARGHRLVEDTERYEALQVYCAVRSPFEYLEHMIWRKGRPTRERIDDLHRHWFERGSPIVLELIE